MLWNLEPGWLMMTVAIVVVIALFFGSALDAIMRDDGFGPVGNMMLFTVCFFAAILAANSYGLNLRDLTRAMATGLGGAFVGIALLALLKGALARF
ncbi:MAG: hypothetical protein H0T56_01600 [Pseudaminobacter sp.]|nr:hypothetical protein [Pseudaminobacter sp.]